MIAKSGICVLFGFSGVITDTSNIQQTNIEKINKYSDKINLSETPPTTANVLARETIELFKKSDIDVAVVVTLPPDYYHITTSWIRSYFGPEVTVYYQNHDTELTPLATKRRAYKNAKEKYTTVFFVDVAYVNLLTLSSENPGNEKYFILVDDLDNQAPWTSLIQRVGSYIEGDQGWADLINLVMAEVK